MRAPFVSLALLTLAGCSSTAGSTGVAPAPAQPAAAQTVEAREAEPPAEALRSIGTAALVEGASSRDPFRAYPSEPPSPPDDARPRKARRIPVDQLRVVGLVTSGASPRAILVDPSGRGHIVGPGDLVGSPEPGSGDRVASFRVDRIRDGAVILVREGGADGRTVDATRVLSLPQTPLLEADD